jgi:hypothetical protein
MVHRCIIECIDCSPVSFPYSNANCRDWRIDYGKKVGQKTHISPVLNVTCAPERSVMSERGAFHLTKTKKSAREEEQEEPSGCGTLRSQLDRGCTTIWVRLIKPAADAPARKERGTVRFFADRAVLMGPRSGRSEAPAINKLSV